MKYALIDTANTFFRARHIASRQADTWEKLGMAMHLSLASVNQMVRMFGIDHVVFALEGRSWRKDFYTPYKANRRLLESSMTEAEQEENELFWNTYDKFISYLREKTNVSVVRCENAEADDIIARFIDLHPDDEHFIISSDSDFVQLISNNVSQYNGVAGQLIKYDGYYTDTGKPVKDKKTGEHKLLEDPEYLLFKKIIRGDSTDNVFSAYPGITEKSSKNRIGIRQAFEDRSKQGFYWNNFMLQRWTDHNQVEQRVKDMYERNRRLIDLKYQPDDIKETIDQAIFRDLKQHPVNGVGIHFMRFCSQNELTKISEQASTYVKWLNSTYSGVYKED